MTSLRNRIIFSCLSIAGTAGLVSFSNPASAAPVEGARQTSVVTADLDLSRPAGRATFERRIAAAARTVCADSALGTANVEASCRHRALVQARRDVGLADAATN